MASSKSPQNKDPKQVQPVQLEEIKFSSLRPLDGFLLGSARFDLPSKESWANRVKQNVLFYQSNYLVLTAFVMLAVLISRPAEFLSGFMTVYGGIGTMSLYFSQKDLSDLHFQYHSTVAALLVTCMVMFAPHSIVAFATGILISAALSFLHASLRLRDIRNKFENAKAVAMKRTPLGFIFDLFGQLNNLE